MSKIHPNADMDAEVEQIIERLGLSPHPEGGCYRETYRSNEKIPPSALPGRYVGERCFGTAIYYLLTPGTFSRLHRLASDEIFHFYLGDPATMLQLHPDGEGRQITLGPDLLAGQHVQVVVPRGVWQGTVLSEGGRFALADQPPRLGAGSGRYCLTVWLFHPLLSASYWRISPEILRMVWGWSGRKTTRSVASGGLRWGAGAGRIARSTHAT